MRRIQRVLMAFVLAVAAFAGWAVGLAAAPAWASCGGQVAHQAVGGNESSNSRLGDKANVLVDSFGSYQYQTWRAVGVLKNSSYFAEAGWLTAEVAGNQGHHPYKTWVNNGVVNTVIYVGAELSTGTNHEFKTHDQNHDHYWSFAYDGIAMGNEFVDMDWGMPITESERACTTDSLYAHFLALQAIRCTNCSWQAYHSLSQYVDNSPDFRFCKISSTEYWVKTTC
jgi:hypothetical protein